jgi:hypothetical protein
MREQLSEINGDLMEEKSFSRPSGAPGASDNPLSARE